jgi:PAT family acetyl-CoA transporter-like MFS transporter 1
MTVAETAFFARISDSLIGGTYMTFLNTVANLGVKWANTFFLWFVDIISWRRCLIEDQNSFNNTISTVDNKCATRAEKMACKSAGGHCFTDFDGYYVEFVFNAIYGIIFFCFARKLVKYLEEIPLDDWHVLSKSQKPIEESIPLKQEAIVSDVNENKSS